jgi:hypothetical protein
LNYENYSHWSSTQQDEFTAFFLYFDNGVIGDTAKGNPSGVIPIRTINF